MDFSEIAQYQSGESPYDKVEPVEVVAGASVVFHLTLPRLEQIAARLGVPPKTGKPMAPVEVKLDGWPDPVLTHRCFLRIGSQGVGCGLTCKDCDAADLPGYNLSINEIVFQVVHGLCNRYVNPDKVEELTIAFFGTGENALNAQAVVGAIRKIHQLLPKARFIISTSGPRTIQEAITEFATLVREGLEIDLQISVPYADERRRTIYMQESGRNKAAVTVKQLSFVANRWFYETGRKAVVSLVVGPSFHRWGLFDYLKFAWRFRPSRCVPKVSVEGRQSDKAAWYDATTRLGWLGVLGYRGYVYDPPGNELGAGCASLELIQLDAAKGGAA